MVKKPLLRNTSQLNTTKPNVGHAADAIRWDCVAFSLGFVLVAINTQGICAVAIGQQADDVIHGFQQQHSCAKRDPQDTILQAYIVDIHRYLDDGRGSLNLPLNMNGTAFQQSVWQAVRKIPFGQTSSYRQIAQMIGKPAAVRAVANACGANPFAVLIPCHRVIRSDGKPSAYRWGNALKQALLAREASLKSQ